MKRYTRQDNIEPVLPQDNILFSCSHSSELLLMGKGDLGDKLPHKLWKKVFHGFFFAFIFGLMMSKSLREACLFASELGSFASPFILMKR